MLNPFDFAQAKLREASRSMNQSVLLAINEILRHFVPQNDIGQEPVISSKGRNPSDAAHKESLLRYMQFTVIGTPSILCEQSVLIWGSTWLAIKFQLGIVAPTLSIAYRVTLAAVILWIYTTLRRLPMRFSLQQHGFMALQGFFLFSLNYTFIYFAEGTLTSGLVAIIFSSIVITNSVFSAIFLKDPIRPRVILGGLMGLFGLVLIFWPELMIFDLSSGRSLGIFLTICGMLLASLGNIVAARNQRSGLPVLQSNTLGMTYGAGLIPTSPCWVASDRTERRMLPSSFRSLLWRFPQYSRI